MKDLRNAIARDLREIVDLWGSLFDEAVNRADDRSQIPGGDAMVMLGPAANYLRWEDQIDEAERLYFEGLAGWIELSDEDSDPAPPLLVLGKWDEIVRTERGQIGLERITVESSARFLSKSLDWICGEDLTGRPYFMPAEDMARDLAALRSRLEAVLHDGIRHDSSAAACFKDVGTVDEPKVCGGQLVRRTLDRRDCPHVERALRMAKGKADPVEVLRQTLIAFPEDEAAHRRCDQGGRDDVYRCNRCRGFYTEAEYWLAVRTHYERQAG